MGTDLSKVTDTIAPIECPFTGEELVAVPALKPDVAVIHAQQSDTKGNVAIWGISGIQKEAALSAKHVIVTVEEVVKEFEPHHSQVVLPSVAVDAIAIEPGGAHPSYAHDYYARDNAFYEAWDSVSRDRDAFSEWMDHHVLGVEDFTEHLESISKQEAVR